MLGHEPTKREVWSEEQGGTVVLSMGSSALGHEADVPAVQTHVRSGGRAKRTRSGHRTDRRLQPHFIAVCIPIHYQLPCCLEWFSQQSADRKSPNGRWVGVGGWVG
jgi:hypothetical protein